MPTERSTKTARRASRSTAPRSASSPSASKLPFGAWATPRAALAALIATLVAALALGSMLASVLGPTLLSLLGIEPGMKLFGAANSATEKATLLVVAVLILALLGRPRIASSFGLRGRRWLPVVALGLAGAVAINVALAAYKAAAGSRGSSVGSQLREFGLGSGAAADLCLIASIVILAPVAEEYLFRALLHKGARDGLSRWVPRVAAIAIGTAISSVVFMQIHLDPAQAGYWPIYLVFGAACALAYELTGSLAAPILVHVFNNGWAFFRGASGGEASFSSPWLYGVLFLAPVLAVALSLGIGRLLGDHGALTTA